MIAFPGFNTRIAMIFDYLETPYGVIWHREVCSSLSVAFLTSIHYFFLQIIQGIFKQIFPLKICMKR